MRRSTDRELHKRISSHFERRAIQRALAITGRARRLGDRRAVRRRRLTPLLEPVSSLLVSCDYSPAMLRQFRLAHRRPCFVGSAFDLPFADRAFDLVFSARLSHHIASDERRADYLREIMRISGGWVIATIFDRDSLKSRMREISRRWSGKRSKHTFARGDLSASRCGWLRVVAGLPLSRLMSGHVFYVLRRTASVTGRATGPVRWTKLEDEPIQDCRVFSVRRIRARSPRTGDAHDFFAIDSSDWVNVVAITPDERVVMVRQFRHGAGRLTLETPGGLVDPGETPAAAARASCSRRRVCGGRDRAARRGEPESRAVQQSTARVPRARRKRVGDVRNESTEETYVELVPLSDLREEVRAGRVDHALVIAIAYLYELDSSLGVGAVRRG
jgi:hypothetical protein